MCALWHFRLVDRALDRLACGRRTARGQSWSPMLADGEARRCFLFGTWRSAVAELFGNRRSQQLAAGQPSDVRALCWILASAERDRSLIARKRVAAFSFFAPFPRAREGGASASGFDPAARAAMGTVRREPIETAGRGVAVRALCWILASAERDRSLNLLGKGAALSF